MPERLTSQLRLALNQKDAAASLGVSVNVFKEHVRPALKPVFINGLLRYRVTELQDWLDRNAE
jgi:predicted DNA-binding protein (UPF0251 family)